MIGTGFYSIKQSWHGFCLYTGGACKSLEFLRQGLVKSVIGVMLKQSELSLLTITDDRIFIEKLANFSIKANASQAGLFLYVEKTLWSMSDFVVLLLGFASTFYNIR